MFYRSLYIHFYIKYSGRLTEGVGDKIAKDKNTLTVKKKKKRNAGAEVLLGRLADTAEVT